MRVRIHDPKYAERLVAFLRSVGVATTPIAPGLLALEPAVEAAELEVYLRVWSVLNPQAAAELEEGEG